MIEASPLTSSNNPILQLLILLVQAKYNYFEMSSGALLGVLIGYNVIAKPKCDVINNNLYSIGMFFIFISAFMSIEANQHHEWFTWPGTLHIWTWLFYAGGLIILYKIIVKCLAELSLSKNKALEFTINLFSVFGILAFPLFIGHEFVIPLKDLLTTINVPFPFVIAFGLFFGTSGYFCRKVYFTFYKSN